MTVSLALYEDDVLPATPLAWEAGVRGVFVRRGQIRVTTGDGDTDLEAGQCRLFTQAVALSGDAQLWTFELSARPVSEHGSSDDPRKILAHDIALNATKPLVLRCDHVAFPPGAETPRHGHKAAGIRRLVSGRLIAEIGHETRRIDAGEAWYESGDDPVVGRSIAPDSAFVRAMVLPVHLHGKPTFIAWSAQEAAKPRGTQRTEFFDTVVRL